MADCLILVILGKSLRQEQTRDGTDERLHFKVSTSWLPTPSKPGLCIPSALLIDFFLFRPEPRR